MDFGPGVLAAFLGARTQVEPNTVWFHPPTEAELADLALQLDTDHLWMRRIETLIAAGQERWGSNVQIGTTDLGGAVDVLSTFRPGEKLLLDLYDHPDDVRRLTWEIHQHWWTCYEHLNAKLQPVNPGYSAWAGVFSTEPSYMLQCDFCYMISPGMFDEFVKPELARSAERLANAFYHLDGVGQLAHLDSLLEIPSLKGVQWVPGDGQPPANEWPGVFEKILAAGKIAQYTGPLEKLPELVDRLGTGKGLETRVTRPMDRRDEMLSLLEKLGVEA